MSWESLSVVWNAKLPTYEKFILMSLAYMTDDQERCWPSINRLAKRTGMSRSTIIRYLNKFKDQGILEAKYRVRENGSNQSTLYRFHSDKVCVYETTQSHPDTTLVSQEDHPSLTVTPLEDSLEDSKEDLSFESSSEDSGNLSPPDEQAKLDWVLARWNAIPGIQSCRKVVGHVRVAVEARVKQYPLVSWWLEYFQLIESCDFLCGKGEGAWSATLDWVCGPKNMSKIFAGNYQNRGSPKFTGKEQRTVDAGKRVMEAIERGEI